MKKKYYIFILLLLLIGAIVFIIYYYKNCDGRTNEFFSKLLNVDNAKVKTICLDYNLSLFSEGSSIEEYKLSTATFDSFLKNKELLDKSFFIENLRIVESDTIILWNKTPNSNILSFFDFEYPLRNHTKCFDIEILSNILEIPDNYYCAAYKFSEYFYFFLIDSRTQTLYVVQNTW